MRFLLAGAIFGAVVWLTGCAARQPFIPLGAATSPPMGAVDFCKRNPKDIRCQR
jgi:predicted transglutaminase-like cysteine proteinase